ncbi:MAG: hypothetical protein BJ554DRAFT_7637, partial [Olpidium bornovanus]
SRFIHEPPQLGDAPSAEAVDRAAAPRGVRAPVDQVPQPPRRRGRRRRTGGRRFRRGSGAGGGATETAAAADVESGAGGDGGSGGGGDKGARAAAAVQGGAGRKGEGGKRAGMLAAPLEKEPDRAPGARGRADAQRVAGPARTAVAVSDTVPAHARPEAGVESRRASLRASALQLPRRELPQVPRAELPAPAVRPARDGKPRELPFLAKCREEQMPAGAAAALTAAVVASPARRAAIAGGIPDALRRSARPARHAAVVASLDRALPAPHSATSSRYRPAAVPSPSPAAVPPSPRRRPRLGRFRPNLSRRAPAFNFIASAVPRLINVRTLSCAATSASAMANSMDPDHKLCMIPGPIEIHEGEGVGPIPRKRVRGAPQLNLTTPGRQPTKKDVRAAMATPSTSHVGPGFVRAFGEALELVRHVVLTKTGQPFIIAGSGTLGWQVLILLLPGI